MKTKPRVFLKAARLPKQSRTSAEAYAQMDRMREAARGSEDQAQILVASRFNGKR